MILMNKSVVAKTALDSDYQTTYTQVDDQHAPTPDPVSSRCQEERNKGVADQRQGQEHTSLGLAQSKLSQV